jgi:uncharacterized radical SAM superfamily Fe-S cluster-containing enzyme
MEAATKRASHDSVLLELTRSICPVCRQLLEAEVLARGGKVYLRKRCPQHGEFEALVYGDGERYIKVQRYNKPGERPLRLQTEAAEGCPRDCGICPEHRQHTCLGIIEVNTGCNLDCPDLLRRVRHRPSAGRLLAHAGAGRADVRHVRRRRGRA